MAEPREALPEDIDFDPTHARQLRLARFTLGIAINRMSREQSGNGWLGSVRVSRDQLRQFALEQGLVWYDDYHHAPMCPANNWGGQCLPEGACNCLAAAR